jgi:N-glycosidase YbiA
MEKVKGFFGQYRFLSNFATVKIRYAGLLFPTVEHAYVAAKTLDPQKHRYVAAIEFPGEAKQYGKRIELRPNWDVIKFYFMRDFLIQKFIQEPYQTKLLNTGNAHLEETNYWGDTVWGVCNGVGENNLGKLLMRVRKGLQDEHRAGQSQAQQAYPRQTDSYPSPVDTIETDFQRSSKTTSRLPQEIIRDLW